MAGRGRNATLPAWMTKGEAKPVTDAPTTIDVAMPEPTPDTGGGKKGRRSRGKSTNKPPLARGVGGGRPAPASGGRGLGATLPAWSAGSAAASSTAAPRGVSQRPLGGGASAQRMPGAGMPPGFGQRGSRPGASSAAPLRAPAAAPTPVHGWTTHMGPTGKPYYYHAATKKSVWEKPDVLKTPQERAVTCPWKAHRAPDGRTYYYNSKTKQSVWTEPEELKAARQIMRGNIPPPGAGRPVAGAPGAAAQAAAPAPAPAPKKKAKPKKPRVLPVYDSKEDAINAFLALLKEKKISSRVHWKELDSKIAYDVRWEAVKNIGERRQLYSEYRDRKAKEEKLAARELRATRRANFEQLLRETTELNPRVSFRHAEEVLEKDERFTAIESSSDRRDIYDDFMSEWDEKERAERRAKKEAVRAPAATQCLLLCLHHLCFD